MLPVYHFCPTGIVSFSVCGGGDVVTLTLDDLGDGNLWTQPMYMQYSPWLWVKEFGLDGRTRHDWIRAAFPKFTNSGRTFNGAP